MNLNNLPIARRLWGAIVLLLAAMFVIAGGTLLRSIHIHKQSAEQVNAARDLAERAVLWKGMTDTAVARGMAVAMSSDPSVGELFKDSVDNDTARIGKLRKQITEIATDDASQAQLKVIGARGLELVTHSKKAHDLAKAGDRATASAMVRNEYSTSAQAYLSAIDKFVELQQARSNAVQAATAETSNGLVIWGAVGALLIMSMGMGVAALLVRSIREPLQLSIEVARAIAGGDLTRSISSQRKDEFGQLMRELQNMNESLGRVVGNVRASTDSISTASAEIATGNQDLSHRTEQTASNLQQAASSMEQLTGTVKQSADAARQANQLASSAAEVAARGGNVVSQVVTTMEEINASSKKISDIIGVIDGIAFQTNILALNAAVEAARAGEQGRGFAVVASEVRSLAQRSAQAAKEIKGLIGASVEKVDSGSRLVADAGQTMSEIVGSVQRVSDIIGEITAASAEQSDGIGTVNSSVNELDQMTQQNAALVEQSAAAAESLKDQARKLADVVAVFKLRA
ncbi:MAG: hypothetical protein RLZZ618_2716 [Pseudomonadota bacterium]